MRVLFMGTPGFAVPALRALVEHAPPGRLWASGLDLVGVLTRVDKPSGRGRHVVVSPVKQYAIEQRLPVYQPGSLRSPEALALLRGLAPDLIVVAAFGQILPPEVLRLPQHGCLNVHASLLPRWRGASPIAAAILAGDAETGVTIMKMDQGLDTGPILAQRATPIGPRETTGELSERLAVIGADLLVETLPLWLAKGIAPQPQDESRATMTHPLHKEDGRLDWRLPAEQLARQVRAYTPAPGAFTTWNGLHLKVLRASVLEEPEPSAAAEPEGASGSSAGRAPGTSFVVGAGHYAGEREGPEGREERRATQGMLACACGQGALALEVVQLQGKRAMSSPELLRGYPALATATLGGAAGG
jgi:methionyl-tRNA formyltransferase